MKGIINGKIYSNQKFIENQVLLFDEEIRNIQPISNVALETLSEVIDAKGQYVLPGFIDVHIHGYKGMDVMDGQAENLHIMGAGLVENGVTSYLATTMTMPKSDIHQALKAVKQAISEQKEHKGAQILGVHLEGPFINAHYKGAQSADNIILPDEEILEHFEDLIKIITIAPEIEGAMEMIEKYGNQFAFSLGHTGASYQIAKEAYEKGAKGATHLFNAMTPLNHREPGVVGAALSCNCYSELVADKIHVHEDLFELIWKAKGAERLVLITDCIRGGGLPEGTYDLGGQMVTIFNGKCTLPSGTIAGSVLKLKDGLKNFWKSTGLPLEQVIPLVTETPATYINVIEKKGTLEPGKDADIVLCDNELNIQKTIVKGSVCYEI